MMVGTWLGECCRQVETKQVSNNSNKIHQTTYQPLFPPLYTYTQYADNGTPSNF